MERRQYSDNDRATALTALDANGGNLRKTSREIGVPISTLKEWRDGRVNADVAEIRTHKKDDLANKFEQIANAYTDRLLDPDVIKLARPGEASTVAGTAIDKMRLLRGLPTEIVAVLPDVVSALQKLGKDPLAIFNDIIRRAELHQ